MSIWLACSAPGTNAPENHELSPDQFHPFARWMRILGFPAAFAPLIAECRSSERGWKPADEVWPTGQSMPLLISLPTCDRDDESSVTARSSMSSRKPIRAHL